MIKAKKEKKLLKKERKLKVKEVFEEVELEKESNDDVGFDVPRIFFQIKIIDDEVLFGDIIFGEPSDQKELYVEFKGVGWKVLYGDD
ncbi:hypothetical protein Glove_198g39 [Diversispora epigaea]|uniref:Uncharacterized protein n=1 Tax=Diversispora epigaea TaxID=1348612 RepID=A0A397IQ69_9GLOM|nr:hypothetical protein Glove_198g39 [Diversispora epigaea]